MSNHRLDGDASSRQAAYDWGEPADYVYVRDAAALKGLNERIRGGESVAVDTEADSLHNYFEKVCLIQLSVGGGHFVVDPLSELEMTGLIEVLGDKRLILHGADYDLRLMRAWKGFRPRGEVFDTMIAAQLLGIEQIGLAALIQQFLEVTIEKGSQKSDWSRRPLSQTQLRYAVNDTRYLEELSECLRGELRERGRLEWHRESCRAVVEATGRDRSRDPEEAWRIKGAGRLTHRQLAYLRELWLWRDMLARRADRPPFKVLQNQKMVELLEWAESHPGEPLDQGPKLPRDIVGSRRSALKHALDRAAAMTPAEWPEFRLKVHAKPTPFDPRELDALRGACTKIAEKLEIAPSTLAPRAALEGIVRQRPRTRDEIMASGGLLHWQAELVRAAVDGTLHASRDGSVTGSKTATIP